MPNIDRIRGMDGLSRTDRPRSREFLDKSGEKRVGRYVFGETPQDVYRGMDLAVERLTTMKEVATLRLQAWFEAIDVVPALGGVLSALSHREEMNKPDMRGNLYRSRGQLPGVLDPVWGMRLLTATHVVKNLDVEGDEDHNGEIFLLDRHLVDQAEAGTLHGEVDDLEEVLDSGCPELTKERYGLLNFEGLSGDTLFRHDVFFPLIGGLRAVEEYVWALQVMSYVRGERGVYHGGHFRGIPNGCARPVVAGVGQEVASLTDCKSSAESVGLAVSKEVEIA
ncbi:hypothetical protein HOE67_01365 [Candidatus Peregrinibacteria bacterium]|jgi:hypothetical protein|nr:hypothetical protein [Candidatus Peregrinibacteria bacterium]MBT4055736.1 hypothetical protein [Candidatus Peregrinibacteria bacterium]